MPGSDARPPVVTTSGSALPSGLPGVWVTALATLAVLVMLGALLWIVVVNAAGWFWPARVSELQLVDGSTRIGIVVAREELPTGADNTRSINHRIQLKVGNRELTRADFEWIDEKEIRSRSTPDDLVRVVRTEYGDAFGRIVDAFSANGRPIDLSSPGALESFLETGTHWRRERPATTG